MDASSNARRSHLSASYLLFFNVRLRADRCVCVDKSYAMYAGLCHNTRPTMLHRGDDKPYLTVSGDSSRPRQIRDRADKRSGLEIVPRVSQVSLYLRERSPLHKIYSDISSYMYTVGKRIFPSVYFFVSRHDGLHRGPYNFIYEFVRELSPRLDSWRLDSKRIVFR